MNDQQMSNVIDQEFDDLDEINEILPKFYSITSYGADYPVDGLVKRLNEGNIIVPRVGEQRDDSLSVVGFQRNFVWTKAQSDRFIESLLLGLPVPGIFLVKEKNGKLLVLDGQQRLLTLCAFYNGIIRKREFTLEYVQQRFKGKKYSTIDNSEKLKLDDYIIHATIIRQDEPEEEQSSIYLIFERLNSGSTLLQPQEIRAALYHGAFSDLLADLNDNKNWRIICGKKTSRLKDVEIILRFLALYYYRKHYKKPMKSFLNKYMAINRDLGKQSGDEISRIFSNTVTEISEHIGPTAFRPSSALNVAVADSVMVGVAARLKKGRIKNKKGLKKAHAELLENKLYIDLISGSTADEENVGKRLEMAIEAFSLVD